MKDLPKKLHQKMEERKANNALRQLKNSSDLIDFSSNDYLGLSRSEVIFNKTHQYLTNKGMMHNGATGSRLLSGNHELYNTLENFLSGFHNSEAALIFNSGYDANLGFFSTVPQRHDVIVYDEFSHASIRDGIRMTHAKSYKFKHNDLQDLEKIMSQLHDDQIIYVVTESVFSMDGDTPDLNAIADICDDHNANLVVDEAHALGVYGSLGFGMIQHLGMEHRVFARLITYGKAFGSHGAAILGSDDLKNYLINFCRPFIYTTALTPHSLATIITTYKELVILIYTESSPLKKLHANIRHFKSETQKQKLNSRFIDSDSAIQSCIIPENDNVKNIAHQLQDKGFDVKPILSPTVSKGQERLRFCIHSYNSKEEIAEVLHLLATFVHNE